MEKAAQKNGRIVWVDIYKALAITLVVTGHATGLFNTYIYQFHLAAFFFISGFVAKQESSGLVRLICKKLYTLYLPLLTFVLLNAGIMAWADHTGTYTFWFGKFPYIGFSSILQQFFGYGRLYVWLLGAAWFLIVLFIVSVATKLMWYLSGKRLPVYFAYSILLYFLGYYCLQKQYLSERYYLDLVLIAQFFYSMGYVVKCCFGQQLAVFQKKRVAAASVVTTLVLLGCSGIAHVTIDYAARAFHNMALNTLTSVNGIIWLYCLSIALSEVKSERFLAVMNAVGQNTLGILLLHFGLFKAGYCLLYAVGVMPQKDIGNVTPEYAMGNRFWWLLVLLSLVFGVLLWKGLKKIPVLSFLIGTDRKTYRRIEELVERSAVVKQIQKIENQCNEGWKKHHKLVGRTALLLVVACYVITFGSFGKQLYESYRPLDIWFPNEIERISFDKGWLDQSNENYRWIRKEGTITIRHRGHKKVKVEGYVPENFEEVHKLCVYVDGTKVATIDTKKNPHFGKTIAIEKAVKSNTFSIRFAFDGVHEPDKDSDDPRTLSGLISHIYLQ